MATSLLELLSRQNPTLKTRKGLILTGLQNDFLSPDGKLPVSTSPDFVDHLKVLVPAFREFGDVIWVRSEYEANRAVNGFDTLSDCVIVGETTDGDSHYGEEEGRDSPVPTKKAKVSTEEINEVTGEVISEKIGSVDTSVIQLPNADEDEDLFLSRTATREPCCIPGTIGADYVPQAKELIDPRKDMQLVQTCYSAFGSTSLLMTLRVKLITEVYIAGSMTNISVYATAMDAARYGIKITLVEDCLCYRKKERHDLAVRRLQEIMGAEVMTGVETIENLRNPPPPREDSDSDEYYDEEYEEEDVSSREAPQQVECRPIEAASDDDEEDEVQFPVPSQLSGRMHQLQFSSPSASLLRQNAATLIESMSRNERDETVTATEPKTESPPPQELTFEPTTEEWKRDGKNVLANTAASTSSPDTRAGQDESSDIIRSFWEQSTRAQAARSAQSKHLGLQAMSNLGGLDQSTVDHWETMMETATQSNQATSHNSSQQQHQAQSRPLFGEDKQAESAGSKILYNLLPTEQAETVFGKLINEIEWSKMFHQTGEVPRLVCCQGTFGEDGSMPVYRHPSDQTLPIQSWTANVDEVRKAAEKAVGHTLNHVLIQLYRSGHDFISEHSDKSLDIVKGSNIVNVSFGAQRIMRLRTKRILGDAGDTMPLARTTYRVPMPHNSMITMSLETNAEYLHGINADKRPLIEWNEAETAFEGQRISLTFRNIGTFLNHDSTRIWGQGATGKSKEEAQPVINGDAAASKKMIQAFGNENQASSINWDATYGDGFDVLHLK